jgi:hypothetical protein
MNKIPFVFFVVSLVVVASVTASPARTVGVNTGDWIKFADIDVTWSSNDPNASKVWYGMDLEMYNQTEWVRAEITQVSGTNVSVQIVEHFKNGTEEISGGWVDVDTGEGVNATSMVIGANLNEGDPIYTAGDYSNWFINETITRVYPDSTRETNHINMTYAYNYTMPPDIEVDYFYSMNFYWDKATGIIVEDSFEVINQTGEYLTAWSMTFKITESSVWVIPEFPTWLAWLAAIGTTTIAVILGKRKLLRLSRDRPAISK